MDAEKHVQKAQRFEATQAKLDPATDWETILEDCFLAAHHYLMAGLDWRGQPHPSTHAHSTNPRLLRQASAPEPVFQAWQQLDRMRSGSIYGGKSNGVASAQARDFLKTIREWAVSARP
jgi:hypothetical protein